jgi:hypothetical protein
LWKGLFFVTINSEKIIRKRASVEINKKRKEEFMEHENNFASKGVAGTALGIGIGALGLEAIRGGLGNIFGGSNGGCESQYVNRYEASQNAKIAALETEVKLRDANTYTDQKILEMYKYVDGKFGVVEAQLCEQRVYNATNTSALACMQGQVAELMALTKRVVPNGSICPGWGDVTVSVTPAPTTGA